MASAFWYKITCQLSLLVSAGVLIVWAVQTFVLPGSTVFAVPIIPAILAGVVVIASTGTLLLRNSTVFDLLCAVMISLMQLFLLTLIATTGALASPFIGLWVFGGLFAYILGSRTLIPSIIFTVGYAAFHTSQSSASGGVALALLLLAPILLSYITWRQPGTKQGKNGSAMTELTRKLSQNSVGSDVIIGAIADGVIVVDENGVIQVINPAAQTLLGWNDDALGLDYRSVMKIVNRNDVQVDDQHEPIQQCLIRSETVVDENLRIQTVSGKGFFVSILASPVGNGIKGAIIVFRDISSQHTEERQQFEFISTASHEMRTPVAAIEGYLGLALNPKTAVIDDDARSYLTKAHESAQHLGQLFQDLLDVSKAEDGRLKSNPVVIDVTTYIGKILEDFTPQFTEKGLSLVYEQSKDAHPGTILPIYYARVDANHLREVFSNLITNAIKYTKAGTVTVNITSNGDRVAIAVTDSGIGIPLEDIPHLFQKFYRVDSSDTREIGGTGLGLYLSRRLVESMDGHLDVTSTYGKGSTFTIDLPRMTQDDVRKTLQELSTAQQQPSAETKV